MSKSLVIFASGSGSNAENIVRYFENHPEIEVRAILTNNPNAGVLDRADRLGIPGRVFNREKFRNPDYMLKVLRDFETDYIILAGFLWLVPSYLVESFERKMINIHPALLPAYGGNGMYGDNVHRAVVADGVSESGITIHFVNERYDEGVVIAQFTCPVNSDDTPDSLAERIHELEYAHFPPTIEQVIKDNS
ncbi:MAG: phosphoribosylglycinamide formyltransferase [Flavobacteriales bacterium]|nr:phosphoribosylglycinamide formyltransferase [Flavobacteriales bacterium]